MNAMRKSRPADEEHRGVGGEHGQAEKREMNAGHGNRDSAAAPARLPQCRRLRGKSSAAPFSENRGIKDVRRRAMPRIAFQPKCLSMYAVPIRTSRRRSGQAAPRNGSASRRPTRSRRGARAFHRRAGATGRASRRVAPSRSAQMVMAAGSVMRDPSSGPSVRIETHQARGVAPPSGPLRPSFFPRTPARAGGGDRHDHHHEGRLGEVHALHERFRHAPAPRENDHRREAARPRSRRPPPPRRRSAPPPL